MGEERHSLQSSAARRWNPPAALAAQPAVDLARDLLAGAEQASGKGADRHVALGQAPAEQCRTRETSMAELCQGLERQGQQPEFENSRSSGAFTTRGSDKVVANGLPSSAGLPAFGVRPPQNGLMAIARWHPINAEHARF